MARSTRPNSLRKNFFRALEFESLEQRQVMTGGLIVSLAEVHSLAEAAAAQWQQTGITPEQLAALQNLDYQVGDLGANHLGRFHQSTIIIDDNAAGNLWFVDETPAASEEFTNGIADSGSLAGGKTDLLTVLLHEQGHALGLSDVIGTSDNVMTSSLDVGTRRLPFSGQADEAIPGSITDVEYITSGPAGSSQPFSTVQPYNTLNYVMALQGYYPSQNVSVDPFIGTVELFAGNFAPRGYAFCQGQLLLKSQNAALFSILGTTYGGDGVTTFALPDLRGRAPVGAGTAPGLHAYALGEKSGGETVTLDPANLASHTHTVPNAPDSGATGGGQPFENRQPTLALNPLVIIEGIFPSRNYSVEELLGSVVWFAGNFAPTHTAFADGRLLSTMEYPGLFSLLGTYFGGNGTTTFALPDLRGRVAIHFGQGPGLTSYDLGDKGGTETITPTEANLPAHAHTVPNSQAPTGTTGGGQAFDNRQPFLALNFQIAMEGLYPSQSLDTENPSEPVVTPGTGLVRGDETLEESAAFQMIEPIVQAAISRWQGAGIDADQVAQLQSATLVIGDLPAGRLAAVEGNVITIDRDAAHRGWFLDVTPNDNLEFGSVDPYTGELLATEESADGHFDLLTALMHEQGHLLGLEHTFQRGDIMYGGLSTGDRKLPKPSDLVQSGEEPTGEPFLESEPFMASVGMFASVLEVRYWASTNGQLLSKSQNTTLFNLLGTTYGGDGVTTFSLPDLQSRVVLGAGQGPGLSNYNLAQRGGNESVTLAVNNLPEHTHELPDTTSPNVSSIVRAGTSPTNAASVTYTVTFSEAVSGVDAADFSLTATVVGASIGTPSSSDGGTTWTVDVNTGSGDGDLRLDVVDDDSIVDDANNPLGGADAGNGNFTTGEIYTIERMLVPGVLQFEFSTYTTAEGLGQLLVNVIRTGGDDGQVGFNVNLLAGGTAGELDATFPTGTFVLNDGETTQQLFLGIIDDDILEGSESFTLQLGNLTGGATLGANSTTAITINDAEDPTLSIVGPTTGVAGQTLTFRFDTADPTNQGVGTVYDYRIDWGDGIPAVYPHQGLSITVQHTFQIFSPNMTSLPYQITATTERSGQFSVSDSVTKNVNIVRTLTAANVFYVGSTHNYDDFFTFTPADATGRNVKGVLNKANLNIPAGVNKVVVYGNGGKEQISFNAVRFGIKTVRVGVHFEIHGGEGNDIINASGSGRNNVLFGDAGNDVLVGGIGADKISGGTDHDILIGGLGRDTLNGNQGDDLLIAGNTSFDSVLAQLRALITTWTGGGAYTARIRALTTGAGPNLTKSTVFNDKVIDSLFGDENSDWFLATTLKQKDKVTFTAGERVTATN